MLHSIIWCLNKRLTYAQPWSYEKSEIKEEMKWRGKEKKQNKILLFSFAFVSIHALHSLLDMAGVGQDYVQHTLLRLHPPNIATLDHSNCEWVSHCCDDERALLNVFPAYDSVVSADKRTISCYLSSHKHNTKIQCRNGALISWTVNAGLSLRWVGDIYHWSGS